MGYEAAFGIKSLNEFYNEVGFGTKKTLTGTDKLSLNILYKCEAVKRKLYQDFINEEVDRNYVELMQLKINPNEASERYPEVDTTLIFTLFLYKVVPSLPSLLPGEDLRPGHCQSRRSLHQD